MKLYVPLVSLLCLTHISAFASNNEQSYAGLEKGFFGRPPKQSSSRPLPRPEPTRDNATASHAGPASGSIPFNFPTDIYRPSLPTHRFPTPGPQHREEVISCLGSLGLRGRHWLQDYVLPEGANSLDSSLLFMKAYNQYSEEADLDDQNVVRIGDSSYDMDSDVLTMFYGAHYLIEDLISGEYKGICALSAGSDNTRGRILIQKEDQDPIEFGYFALHSNDNIHYISYDIKSLRRFKSAGTTFQFGTFMEATTLFDPSFNMDLIEYTGQWGFLLDEDGAYIPPSPENGTPCIIRDIEPPIPSHVCERLGLSLREPKHGSFLYSLEPSNTFPFFIPASPNTVGMTRDQERLLSHEPLPHDFEESGFALISAFDEDDVIFAGWKKEDIYTLLALTDLVLEDHPVDNQKRAILKQAQHQVRKLLLTGPVIEEAVGELIEASVDKALSDGKYNEKVSQLNQAAYAEIEGLEDLSPQQRKAKKKKKRLQVQRKFRKDTIEKCWGNSAYTKQAERLAQTTLLQRLHREAENKLEGLRHISTHEMRALLDGFIDKVNDSSLPLERGSTRLRGSHATTTIKTSEGASAGVGMVKRTKKAGGGFKVGTARHILSDAFDVMHRLLESE